MVKHEQLLQILADGKYHSGTELGEQLGVSRAAICKLIHRVEHDTSLDIYAVRGRGYRLAVPLQLLDRVLIEQQFSSAVKKSLQAMDIFLNIPSTSTYLNEKSLQGIPAPYLVLAESQSQGQGRRGKRWVSPFASNLYLSLLWRFPCGPSQLGSLSLLVALAVVQVTRALGIEGVGIKWPNDILWQGKKLAGVLLEMRGEANGPSSVIIGIGMNIAMSLSTNRQVNHIVQPWTDLQSIIDKPVDRNEVTALLVNSLFEILQQLPDRQSGLLQQWEALDILKGQQVDVHYADKVISGVAQGINAQGALRVLHNNQELICHSGEVSIRCRVL